MQTSKDFPILNVHDLLSVIHASIPLFGRRLGMYRAESLAMIFENELNVDGQTNGNEERKKIMKLFQMK